MELSVWLQGISERNCFIPYDGDRGGCVVAGLDFIHAIEWHMKWRTDLEQCLKGGEMPMPDIDVVSRDDMCQLGKWLNGEGKRIYGVREEFIDLIRDHAHFHLCAGDLLACYLEKKTCTPELRQNFLHASELVLKHLAQLYLSLINGNDAQLT